MRTRAWLIGPASAIFSIAASLSAFGESLCQPLCDDGACRGIKNEAHMRSRPRKSASDRSVSQYRQSTTAVALAVDYVFRHRRRHGMPQRIQKVASTMPGTAVGKHFAACFDKMRRRTIFAALKMLLSPTVPRNGAPKVITEAISAGLFAAIARR
jgi:hypothetical protein